MINNLTLYRAELASQGCSYRENVDLGLVTYFKYGGRCHTYVTPTNTDELIFAIKGASKYGLVYSVIGNTTNIILSDSITYCVMISTKGVDELEVIDGETLRAGAGALLSDVVRIAFVSQAPGYEGLEGVPATVAGAIVMNAGAYGASVAEKVKAIRVLDIEKGVIRLNAADCQFERRSSIVRTQPNIFVLDVDFDLVPSHGSMASSLLKAERFHIARHSYQEYVLPNLGSLFTMKENLYEQLFKKRIDHRLVYFFVRLFFTNKLIKFFRRKRPTNEPLNKLFKKFSGLTLRHSHKSMNILVNDGTLTDEKILEHLRKMSEIVGDAGELENELVTHTWESQG
jgi:UDP-N-acetylmuramate dehydrogenase